MLSASENKCGLGEGDWQKGGDGFSFGLFVCLGGGVCECDHDQKTLKFYFGRADFFFPLLLLNSVSE